MALKIGKTRDKHRRCLPARVTHSTREEEIEILVGIYGKSRETHTNLGTQVDVPELAVQLLSLTTVFFPSFVLSRGRLRGLGSLPPHKRTRL